MSNAWKDKNFDLTGDGLQSANLKLIQMLKKRPVAYKWLILFPTGMHRTYLNSPQGAWAFRLLSLGILICFGLGYMLPAWILLAVQTGFALYDIRWIETNVASLNKAMRMSVYLKPGNAAPKSFKGRYTDDGLDDYISSKEQERGGHTPIQPAASTSASRIPSFAEQEAMLRELAKAKQKKD